MNQNKRYIADFLQKIKAANKELTKKEIFKDLLHRLYGGVKEIDLIIDAISSGSEKTILNIPRKDKLHRGSADTLYNKIIIEFENDLKVTQAHAKEQLAGYLLGQYNSGEGYHFTLIASDFIHWKVYAPEISQLSNLEGLNEHQLVLNEVASASFTLTETNAVDFYYWIDRFLFKEEKQKATLQRIEESFGYTSPVFIECFMQISHVLSEAKKYGEVQVSYEQWRKFLSIAYGSFDDSDERFVIHTYLSILAKVLAYEVLSNDDYINDSEMHSILTGSVFHRYNIRNFVDNDFFHWVDKDRYFQKLKKSFRLITQEIAHFDFDDVQEDVLKGVYQELIDLDTRHSLGEYYTPDWLCERIVQEYDFKKNSRILDPACGSGSFLRAAVHRLRNLHEDINIEELNDAVHGIDIHPLSVQIAKTTLLITLGKDIIQAKKPVHLNIILANTLLAPQGVQTLFGGDFQMTIDKEKFKLTTQILDDVKLFDDGLELCEELAEQTMHQKSETLNDFSNIFKARYKNRGISLQVTDSFYKIYIGLKKVKEDGRDSIWKFIVQNLYKPYFLNKKFDYVVGNPPWFTFSSIRNGEYQDILNQLAKEYHVKPASVANFPHLEIAAIFLAYCSSYFLRDGGKIAFVLPRSFFSADHHDNTRSGKAQGFKITSAWDLQQVQPLFRIPSCVLFAAKAIANEKRNLPAKGLSGKVLRGRLPAHNCTLDIALPKLTETETVLFYSKQGNSSALSETKGKQTNKINPYKVQFKQGATIVPRAFYFVELDQETPPDFEDRILNIKTAGSIKADAKMPWKNYEFKGQIESRFLFRTALSKSILPFALYNPDMIVLPITTETGDDGLKQIKLHSAGELRQLGYLKASKWFMDKERIWEIHRTAKSANMTANDRINFQRGVTDQDLNARFLVLYNSSAKDANAAVVDRINFDLDFLVESVCYVMYTNCKEEAYYLTAILNSSSPNEMMKDFQAKGLFGPRHVHKKILDIYYPLFDENNKLHQKLTELSKAAHEKTAAYLAANPPQQSLTAVHLGRLRTAIKKHLSKEMQEMDVVVGRVLKG